MARRINDRDLSPVLDAASAWIGRCLIEDEAMFEESGVWTASLIDEVRRAFIDHPDEGKDEFTTQLKGQMKSCSPSAQRLMAEMLWALLLFPSNIRAHTKRQQVRELWAQSGQELPAWGKRDLSPLRAYRDV